MLRDAILAQVVMLVACAQALPTSPPPVHDVEDERSATVALVNNVNDAYQAFCSGVWVGEGRIVTAAHCFTEPKVGERVTFSMYEDVERPSYWISDAHAAHIVKLRSDRDLVLLETSYPPPHSHVWATVAPQPRDGTTVSVVGHPDGMLYSWLPGVVAADRLMITPSGEMRVTQITSSAWKGNSGGGAFDASGRLVGICSFVGAPQQSFFVHRDHIEDLL